MFEVAWYRLGKNDILNPEMQIFVYNHFIILDATFINSIATLVKIKMFQSWFFFVG